METILFILLWLAQSSEMDSSKFCLQVTHTQRVWKGLLLILRSFLGRAWLTSEVAWEKIKEGRLSWGFAVRRKWSGINILTCANSYCRVWTSHWCQKRAHSGLLISLPRYYSREGGVIGLNPVKSLTSKIESNYYS